MNLVAQSTSARTSILAGPRAAVAAAILAIVLVAALVVAYALATNGTFAGAGTRSGSIPTAPDFNRGEHAPQR